MTSTEFNEKWEQHIPEGFHGLEFDIPEVTEYLETIMPILVLLPEFELYQIKLKFNQPRFYCNIDMDVEVWHAIQVEIEKKIKELCEQTQSSDS